MSRAPFDADFTGQSSTWMKRLNSMPTNTASMASLSPKST
ncbi:hypothetical protein CCACVL1_20065 [Corchorus capsularis]|uniref:Uncharacterized protein n=1 Tax=Corchorus capsularis TaxID=210143 RepID=A0A1R3HCR9_COCAP|nr:hypothetical protein CCACVL1_20065 [Corchorus capsularis]